MTDEDMITPDTLRFERLLPAPIETVWAYLVDPELRKMWFMGGAIGTKPGDDIEMVMDHRNLSDGDVPTPEKYAPYIGNRWAEKIVSIESPHLLAFGWERGEAGTVTIELTRVGERTRLVLPMTGYAAATMRPISAAAGRRISRSSRRGSRERECRISGRFIARAARTSRPG